MTKRDIVRDYINKLYERPKIRKSLESIEADFVMDLLGKLIVEGRMNEDTMFSVRLDDGNYQFYEIVKEIEAITRRYDV